MKPQRFLSLCYLVILTSLAPPLIAQSSDTISGSVIFQRPETFDSRFFTLTFENDAFVGEDDGFTNGLGLTYGRGPFISFTRDNIPRPLHWLTKRTYISTRPDKVRGIAYTLFQTIQTPKDIAIPELQLDDIPYAGLLSLQTIMYAWDRNSSDQLTFQVGAIGPIAFADEAQTTIHELTGSQEPLGWDNQLENELVFSVSALRSQKLYRRYGPRFGMDVLGIAQGGIGTILSSVSAGLAVRVGTHMEFSHATFDLQSDRHVNSLALADSNEFYVYAGATGKYVFNDILLNGNNFEDSHSAPLYNAQNLITGGVVAKYGRFAYVFQLSSFSSRTTLSSGREKLGALSFTVAF